MSKYRKNIGIIILDDNKNVLIAKRTSKNNDDYLWQFPQGGIHDKESTINALYREIKEELNLDINDFDIIFQSSNWLYYDISFSKDNVSYIGQKQKWFLVKLKTSPNKIINFLNANNGELSQIKFVPYWFPISSVIDFKQKSYKNILYFFVDIYNNI